MSNQNGTSFLASKSVNRNTMRAIENKGARLDLNHPQQMLSRLHCPAGSLKPMVSNVVV
jgi:hypothetical protein